MIRTRRVLIDVAIVVTILVQAPFATATHQVDHRVTVRGAIYDSVGIPQARSELSVIDPEGEVLGTTKTSKNGKFQLILHLHDEDVGRKLLLRTGTLSQEFQLTFDPHNIRKERIVLVTIGDLSPELRRRQSIFTGVGAAVIAIGLVSGTIVLIRKKQHYDKSKKKRTGKKPGKSIRNSGASRSPPTRSPRLNHKSSPTSEMTNKDRRLSESEQE